MIKKINCLDKGYVELISYTPDGDLLVVNAARASFDKQHLTFDNQKDTKLINYLAEHKHVLPFRHPHVTLRLYCPIFILRQLGKHQVGFSWSEVSRRYISTEPEFYVPSEWRKTALNVKQGSSDEISISSELVAKNVSKSNADAINYYNNLIKDGICAEQARTILPQSMYTTTITTGSLLGWMHLYKQRTDSHTQKETREYAFAIGQIINELYPISFNALKN
jgi:thymidylate synthase (FAD)